MIVYCASMDVLGEDKKNVLLFVVSWALVAFGQPSWLPWFCPISAICGYALFWYAMTHYHRHFLFGAAWYFCVHVVQLSWMSSTEFVGDLVALGGVMLAALWALQFGVLCIFVRRRMTFFNALTIASLWTLMEWSRLYILCGYTFNPAGLALTWHHYPMQLASLVGVYGLSFWVIFTNALCISKPRWLMPFVIAVPADSPTPATKEDSIRPPQGALCFCFVRLSSRTREARA